jgi:hypothetical protein
MQSVDFKPSPPDNAPFSESGSIPSPYDSPRSAEPFEDIMGRMMTRSTQSSASDDTDSSDELSKKDRKPDRPRRTDSSSSTQNAVGAADTPTRPDPNPAASAGNASSGPAAQGVTAEKGAASGQEQAAATNTADSQSAQDANPPKPTQGSTTASGKTKSSDGDSLKNLLTGALPEAAKKISIDPTAALAGKNLLAAKSDAQENSSVATEANLSGAKPFAPALPAGVQVSGISGAKYPVAMQKAENMKDFAGSAEQNLPTADTGIPSAISASLVDSASALGSAQESSATLMRTLDRTNELMSLHAVSLRDTGGDSMLVVIKPGSDLHLSLNLKMKDGNVDIEARLHQGDFNFLSRHWSDLQEQLSHRGIRLANLTSNEFSHRDRDDAAFTEQFRRRRSEEMASHVRPRNDSSKVKTVSKTKSSRGWESWA